MDIDQLIAQERSRGEQAYQIGRWLVELKLYREARDKELPVNKEEDWISVEGRLPHHSDRVVVWGNDFRPFIARHKDGRWKFDHNLIANITHWKEIGRPASTSVAVEAQPPVNKEEDWISVEERLPDMEQWGRVRTSDLSQFVAWCNRQTGVWRMANTMRLIDNVTHWRPVKKPMNKEEGGWIKVSDRLPDTEQLVLVCCIDPLEAYEARYNSTTGQWRMANSPTIIKDVMSWRPLQQPVNIDSDGWIKVSDRLPDPSHIVFMWCGAGMDRGPLLRGHYSHNRERWYYDGTNSCSGITHWREIESLAPSDCTSQ